MIGSSMASVRRAGEPVPRKTRVAFVFNHPYFLGGGEVSLSELVRGLDKTVFDPLVVVPGKGGILEHFASQGYTVAEIPFPSLRRPLPPRPLSAVFHFARRLKREQVRLIHANGSRVCLYSVLAGRLLGLPVVWHVRETIRDYLFYDAFLALLSKTVVCASQSILEKRFRTLQPWIRRKAVVIHNGVDTAAFRRDNEARTKKRRELGIGDNEILFGILGNIIPLKGQDFFLMGLAEALKHRPDLPVKALLMGRILHSAYFEHLRHIVQSLELEERVLFCDYHPRVLDTFSALDVFVLPSQREGFSRSLLEAMSVGLPVLATRLSEIQEAVTDGDNALLVDPGDTRQMALHLVELSEDASLRERMGERNRLRAVESFDLSLHVRGVENLYKKFVPNNHDLFVKKNPH